MTLPSSPLKLGIPKGSLEKSTIADQDDARIERRYRVTRRKHGAKLRSDARRLADRDRQRGRQRSHCYSFATGTGTSPHTCVVTPCAACTPCASMRSCEKPPSAMVGGPNIHRSSIGRSTSISPVC